MKVCKECQTEHKLGSSFNFGENKKSSCTICGKWIECNEVEPDLSNPIRRRSFGDGMDGVWAVCPYCGTQEDNEECDMYEGGGDITCHNCDKEFHYYVKVDLMCETEGAEE